MKAASSERSMKSPGYIDIFAGEAHYSGPMNTLVSNQDVARRRGNEMKRASILLMLLFALSAMVPSLAGSDFFRAMLRVRSGSQYDLARFAGATCTDILLAPSGDNLGDTGPRTARASL